MNQQQLKAEALFKSYTDACGMDADDIRAAKWYAAGMVDYTKFLLEEGGMQGEGERLREEVERLRGERDGLRIAAEALLNGLSKEHSGGKAMPRSIHVILKIKALKEVLALKPQTEHGEGEKQWISVKDRLPYKDGDSQIFCLVWDTYEGHAVVRPYNEYHKCWDGEDADDFYTDATDGNISHWMPLPPKPQSHV